MSAVLINSAYFVAAVLFILGLKAMAKPATARKGIIWAGVGMGIAAVVTFGHPQVVSAGFGTNLVLMITAIVIGGGLAWWSGRRVAMTDMPQMIAMYNGMGGGAAATIAAAIASLRSAQ